MLPIKVPETSKKHRTSASTNAIKLHNEQTTNFSKGGNASFFYHNRTSEQINKSNSMCALKMIHKRDHLKNKNYKSSNTKYKLCPFCTGELDYACNSREFFIYLENLKNKESIHNEN